MGRGVVSNRYCKADLNKRAGDVAFGNIAPNTRSTGGGKKIKIDRLKLHTMFEQEGEMEDPYGKIWHDQKNHLLCWIYE